MRDWKLSDAVSISLNSDHVFLQIKETLTRLGIANNKNKELFQTAHILHKKRKYYIVHFKILFALDGRPTEFNEEDWKRQNTIARLLEDWQLCKINGEYLKDELLSPSSFKILKHADKHKWKLVTKYSSLGKNTNYNK